jgi:glycosyltransferase involved in cell wall biosynthesis
LAKNPLVTIGMPVFNGERFIRKALDSLLAQTFTDFELIISDNASTDGSLQISQEYAARDGRISVYHNERNMGMCRNFRIVFEKGRGEYFMWAADHDLWHPEFLQAHVEALADDREIVMAHPRVVAISAEDEVLPVHSPDYDSVGMNKLERIRDACGRMSGAGNMVYGLFRSDVIAKCGVYARCAAPDRLLMLEASVYGTFKQIPRELWFRRYPGRLPKPGGGVAPDYDQVLARQRAILFENGDAPWYSRFPIIGHAFGLIYHLSLRPPSGSYANAHLGPYMVYLHVMNERKFLKEEIHLFLKRKKEVA